MEYRPITAQNRDAVNAFIHSRWYGTEMVVHGELIDMTRVDGIAAYDEEDLAGLIMYRIVDNACEILSLDSLREGRGIGTTLVERVIKIAKERQCGMIKVTTTNDNINAIRFYQKQGFSMIRLYPDAIDTARRVKPSIPLTGCHGIPIRHEIELEIDISG